MGGRWMPWFLLIFYFDSQDMKRDFVMVFRNFYESCWREELQVILPAFDFHHGEDFTRSPCFFC